MFIILLGLWVLLCGRVTVEILLIGAGVSALCCLAGAKLLGWNREKGRALWRRAPKLLSYFLLLLREIWQANMAMLPFIYGKKKPRPEYAEFDVPLRTKGARIAFADSITLTPGTITALSENRRFTVHCFDASMKEGLAEGGFVKALARVEGEEGQP